MTGSPVFSLPKSGISVVKVQKDGSNSASKESKGAWDASADVFAADVGSAAELGAVTD